MCSFLVKSISWDGGLKEMCMECGHKRVAGHTLNAKCTA